MSDKEIDSVLSGIIILLLLIVVWKWHSGNSSCGQSNMTISCGCKLGRCRCRGMSNVSVMRRGRCSGGNGCGCGCHPGRCGCTGNCGCQHNARSNVEGMIGDNVTGQYGVRHVTGSGANPVPASIVTQDYSGTAIKGMSLENEVEDSHNTWCDQLSFAGMPTGSSSCTVLEETGRSYGTADYVGLTSRKFCKARQLAIPAPDARVTPSQSITEWCGVEMDELV